MNRGSSVEKQVVSLQFVTIVWMCIEAAVSIFAAIRAHSVALLVSCPIGSCHKLEACAAVVRCA
jgi:hypothetical protein